MISQYAYSIFRNYVVTIIYATSTAMSRISQRLAERIIRVVLLAEEFMDSTKEIAMAQEEMGTIIRMQ
jgi:hypothetical protein